LRKSLLNTDIYTELSFLLIIINLKSAD